ncbi:MAG: hypothetical protein GQ531_06875 [Sulfurovum sp.]|nr:hypothetical protein [Sulfurovum sp.]
MKYRMLLLSGLLSVFAYADYVEVKSASGTSSYNSSTSNKLHVCYDKRIKVVVEGDMYLGYRGCTRERYKCKSLGKVHFGKYPSSSKASAALNRCLKSRPRFVD